MIVAVGVNTDGRREVLGMTTGRSSEAEPFWVEFLRSLASPIGRRGVKFVISDAHEGLKAAITKILSVDVAALPGPLHAQCRMAYAGKTQRRIVSAWIGTAFAQDDGGYAARKQWRDVADQARPRMPKLAALMDDAETDACWPTWGFPPSIGPRSTLPRPIERPEPRDQAPQR